MNTEGGRIGARGHRITPAHDRLAWLWAALMTLVLGAGGSACAASGGNVASIPTTSALTATTTEASSTPSTTSPTTAPETPTTTAPTSGAPPAPTVDVSSSQPTLGTVWAPNQKGYGEIRPTIVFNGGATSGLIEDVTWDSWGGPEARGRGQAYDPTFATPGTAPAVIVAYDLGSCAGATRYRAVTWYFPGRGETFVPANGQRICGEAETTTSPPLHRFSGRPYRINPKTSLPLHSGPHLDDPVLAEIPTGTTITVYCVKLGDNVDGPFRANDRYWLRTGYGDQTGYVTDQYVVTRTDVDDRSIIEWCD